MIRKNRRTRIVIETERVVVVHSRGGGVERWCSRCGAIVRMVRLEEAAAVAATSQRDIVRLLDSGSVHFIEALHGALFICIPSLLPDIHQ